MIVDAAAHPVVRHGDELREYMPEPWRSRPFPGPERYQYAAPDGEYAERPESGLPGSDPAALPRSAGGVEREGLSGARLPDYDRHPPRIAHEPAHHLDLLRGQGRPVRQRGVDR